MAEKFNGRKVTIGRVAHLTAPLPHDPSRGCLSVAQHVRPGLSVWCLFQQQCIDVASRPENRQPLPCVRFRWFTIIYDEQSGEGRWREGGIDATTKEEIDLFAKVIFLNASALGSTFIPLNSFHPASPTDWATAVINWDAIHGSPVPGRCWWRHGGF